VRLRRLRIPPNVEIEDGETDPGNGEADDAEHGTAAAPRGVRTGSPTKYISRTGAGNVATIGAASAARPRR